MVVNQQPVSSRSTHQLCIEVSEITFWLNELPKRIAKQEQGLPRAKRPDAYMQRLNEDRQTLQDYKDRMIAVKGEIKKRES